MGNENFFVTKFAHTLRVSLYCEHVGISPEEAKDPISEVTWNKIKSIANVNL